MEQELSHALTKLCNTANFILVLYAIGLVISILSGIFSENMKESENSKVYDSENKF